MYIVDNYCDGLTVRSLKKMAARDTELETHKDWKIEKFYVVDKRSNEIVKEADEPRTTVLATIGPTNRGGTGSAENPYIIDIKVEQKKMNVDRMEITNTQSRISACIYCDTD